MYLWNVQSDYTAISLHFRENYPAGHKKTQREVDPAPHAPWSAQDQPLAKFFFASWVFIFCQIFLLVIVCQFSCGSYFVDFSSALRGIGTSCATSANAFVPDLALEHHTAIPRRNVEFGAIDSSHAFRKVGRVSPANHGSPSSPSLSFTFDARAGRTSVFLSLLAAVRSVTLTVLGPGSVTTSGTNIISINYGKFVGKLVKVR